MRQATDFITYVCLLAVISPSAFASCPAFPTLARMIVDAEALAGRAPGVDLREMAISLDRRQEALSLSATRAAFASYGYGRHGQTISNFFLSLEHAGGLANSGQTVALLEMLRGSSFHSDTQQAREALERICGGFSAASLGDQNGRAMDVSQGDGGSNALRGIVTVATGTIIFVLVLATATIVALVMKEKRDARRAKRFACDIPVSVKLNGETHSLRIVDISPTGANLAHDLALEPDTMLALRILQDFRPAKVVWCNHQFAGLAFKTALKDREFAELRAQDQAQTSQTKKKRGTRKAAAST